MMTGKSTAPTLSQAETLGTIDLRHDRNRPLRFTLPVSITLSNDYHAILLVATRNILQVNLPLFEALIPREGTLPRTSQRNVR